MLIFITPSDEAEPARHTVRPRRTRRELEAQDDSESEKEPQSEASRAKDMWAMVDTKDLDLPPECLSAIDESSFELSDAEPVISSGALDRACQRMQKWSDTFKIALGFPYIPTSRGIVKRVVFELVGHLPNLPAVILQDRGKEPELDMMYLPPRKRTPRKRTPRKRKEEDEDKDEDEDDEDEVDTDKEDKDKKDKDKDKGGDWSRRDVLVVELKACRRADRALKKLLLRAARLVEPSDTSEVTRVGVLFYAASPLIDHANGNCVLNMVVVKHAVQWGQPIRYKVVHEGQYDLAYNWRADREEVTRFLKDFKRARLDGYPREWMTEPDHPDEILW